tara:strand:+ start:170 stop:460 length:291 start_codon:yes stop_codon:yes gene_type:complete
LAEIRRYWVSWICEEEDYRPVKTTINGLVGYWHSGWDLKNNAILCALVEAVTKEEAEKIIRDGWPETEHIGEWRIFYGQPLHWIPGDRFPIRKGVN